MARPRHSGVDEGQRIRELRKEMRRLETKEEPGPERAALLAGLVRSAHEERQLNMAMHAASLCIEEDPDPPSLLIDAYVTDDLLDPEERLRTFVDLQDLARYVGDDELRGWVDERIDTEARDWVRAGTEQERRHRLRTLTSMVGQSFADEIRDEIQFL